MFVSVCVYVFKCLFLCASVSVFLYASVGAFVSIVLVNVCFLCICMLGVHACVCVYICACVFGKQIFRITHFNRSRTHGFASI